ncbi:hypothetical protein H4R33_000292 [Dimargaris cristalligena]|uniref:SMP-30/Gluconolactonase/LRE-like region domain-containing protein n=1 Tax=Dimargaris cristalligena TaxID=215637 RepID=A0A4Q0A219_9FUNG|nr:hypothetical protein H4R33_000292 [Dimargaris cristalligena]RKP40143.1 hypothetical protein BJ085DRAFT_33855 [Dimargaris cristalligena]|eukprot:RKP40143.1 hypothetical protein BJ085DRAFT_33855 [Dimargaris cristalligena]
MARFSALSILALSMAAVLVHAQPISKCHPSTPTTDVPSVDATVLFAAGQTKLGQYLDAAGIDQQGDLFVGNNGLVATSNSVTKLTGISEPSIYYTSTDSNLTVGDIRFRTVKSNNVVTKQLYLTDLTTPRVMQLSIDMGTGLPTTDSLKAWCQDASMLRPMGLDVTSAGHAYLVGQNNNPTSGTDSGDVWFCSNTGAAQRLDQLSRPNGVAVSAAGDYLYVVDSRLNNAVPYEAKVWQYTLNKSTGLVQIAADGAPVKKLLVDFESLNKTGSEVSYAIITDVGGNFFVARSSLNLVLKFSVAGKLLQTIKAPTTQLTSIALGGTDGKTLYMVGSCKNADATQTGCTYTWINDAAGTAWTSQQ